MQLADEILDEASVLFEDIRLAELDPQRHADFIIARVLDRGSLASIRALFRMYGRETIRDFFTRGGVLQLSRRTVPLWTAFFDLPADACTPKSSPRRRSPYWSD